MKLMINWMNYIKVYTKNINRELDDQGDLLDNIDDKMTRVNTRVHKQNRTMNIRCLFLE